MNDPKLHEFLECFETISLDEMDNVKLMDRTDTKFVFHFSRLLPLLDQIKNQYRVLFVDGKKCSTYESVYFDTEDFRLFKEHHRGKMNRVKVRFRTYCSSMLQFFEVKRKNNKGRTVKDRIKTEVNPNQIHSENKDFLEKKTILFAEQLQPKLKVTFSRITLVNKSIPERLTIDVGLTFSLPDETDSYVMSEIVIAELKQDKVQQSGISDVFHRNHIYKNGFSKYCFGTLFMYPNLKRNNFKSKLLKINKIRHESDHHTYS